LKNAPRWLSEAAKKGFPREELYGIPIGFRCDTLRWSGDGRTLHLSDRLRGTTVKGTLQF
jgi:hypothetical protein